jgi:hypothetical protein
MAAYLYDYFRKRWKSRSNSFNSQQPGYLRLMKKEDILKGEIIVTEDQ